MFRNLLAVLSLSLLCGTAFAQEKPENKTCRILFLERPAAAPQTLYLFDGVSTREVNLPGMNLSPVYELPPTTTAIALLTEIPVDPKVLPPGAPTAKIPGTLVDFYLLLMSDPSNKIAPVKMHLVNANNDKLQLGQMMWFNLTDMTIGGRLGTEKILLNPRSQAIMDAPAPAGDYSVSLAYRVSGKELTYPICETQWTHDPRSRSLAFVIAKEGARTPRVHVYPDFRVVKKEKKTP